MVDEKFQTLLSMQMTPQARTRVAKLLGSSDSIALSGKVSPNLISLDQISAENKFDAMHQSQDKDFHHGLSMYDQINHDYFQMDTSLQFGSSMTQVQQKDVANIEPHSSQNANFEAVNMPGSKNCDSTQLT